MENNMWVKPNERTLINIDAKIVKIQKYDYSLPNGTQCWSIAFYESLDIDTVTSDRIVYSTQEERDNAFSYIEDSIKPVEPR